MVDRCVAVIPSLSCEPNWTQLYCSSDVLVGKVEGPGPCYLDEECASGECLQTNGCPGTCEPLRKAGEPCGHRRNGDPLCDPRTAKCDTTSSLCVALSLDDACVTDSDCVVGQFCQRPGTAGSCKPLGTVDCRCVSRGPAGAECSTWFACQDGLYCDGTTCRAPGKSGEPCRFGSTFCEIPLTCLRSPDLVNGVCGVPRAEGEECLRSSDCAPNSTCRGADLVAQPPLQGKCGPFGSLNEPCGTSGANYCSIGLSCRSGTCQNRPGAGDACRTEVFSGDGCFGTELICISSSPGGAQGTCGPFPSVGDTCSSACAKGAYCSISGRCVAQANAGENCAQSDECLSGACGSDGKCILSCMP